MIFIVDDEVYIGNLLEELLSAERRRLQSDNAERMDAVTNASHDLRTPPTAILGYLDLLNREEMNADFGLYIAVIRERRRRLQPTTPRCGSMALPRRCVCRNPRSCAG